MNPNHPRTILRIERIKQAISNGPLSIYDMADAIFLSPSATQAYITYLHDSGKMHIERYKRQLIKEKRAYLPLWRWGPGKDAKQPVYANASERAKESYRNMIKDVDRNERRLALRRIRERPVRRERMVGALFGAHV